MACKYFSHEYGKGWCKAGSSEVSVEYSTEKKYCTDDSWYQKCPKYPKSSGGCFITSACVNAKGLPDDCMELATMRVFRDHWLKKQPNGGVEIARYYEIAPIIVEKIDADYNSIAIYERIYNDYITPCVLDVGKGQNEAAYIHYKTMITELEDKYYHS